MAQLSQTSSSENWKPRLSSMSQKSKIVFDFFPIIFNDKRDDIYLWHSFTSLVANGQGNRAAARVGQPGLIPGARLVWGTPKKGTREVHRRRKQKGGKGGKKRQKNVRKKTKEASKIRGWSSTVLWWNNDNMLSNFPFKLVPGYELMFWIRQNTIRYRSTDPQLYCI